MIDSPIFRYVWLVFIAVTVLNALTLKSYSRSQIQQRPELAAGYRRLFWGLLFWGNLPWVVMGVGMLSGRVPSLLAFLRPRDGNPFVLAWFGVVIALWILGFYWIFARGGAELLFTHPGLIRGGARSPAMIRVLYCFMLAGGICALLLVCLVDFPEFP